MLVHVHTKCPRAAECWNYLPRSQWGLETRSESGIVQSHISTLLSLLSPPPPTFQNNEVVSRLCDVRISLLGCVHSDEAPLSWEIKWFGLFRGTGLGALALTWPVNRTSRSRRPRVQPQLGGGGGVGETFWTAGVLCEAGNKYTTFRSYFSRARTTLALNVPFLSKGSLVPFFFQLIMFNVASTCRVPLTSHRSVPAAENGHFFQILNFLWFRQKGHEVTKNKYMLRRAMNFRC